MPEAAYHLRVEAAWAERVDADSERRLLPRHRHRENDECGQIDEVGAHGIAVAAMQEAFREGRAARGRFGVSLPGGHPLCMKIGIFIHNKARRAPMREAFNIQRLYPR